MNSVNHGEWPPWPKRNSKASFRLVFFFVCNLIFYKNLSEILIKKTVIFFFKKEISLSSQKGKVFFTIENN
jgi:hypothetical protein